MIEDRETSLDGLIEGFYSDVRAENAQTEGVFSCILGPHIDWDKMNEPVTIRPIPAAWYSMEKVIYAVRHYNRALPIVWGDMTFSTIRAVPYRRANE